MMLQLCKCILFLCVVLQGTTRGDDTIREILVRLHDLSGYTDLFTFDASSVDLPNVLMDNSVFCNCKDLIAQDILKTLVLIKTTDQAKGQEPHMTIRMLKYNIKSLLADSRTAGEHCPRDKAVVRLKTRQRAHVVFVKQCIAFFQAWMRRCVSSSDY